MMPRDKKTVEEVRPSIAASIGTTTIRYRIYNDGKQLSWESKYG